MFYLVSSVKQYIRNLNVVIVDISGKILLANYKEDFMTPEQLKNYDKKQKAKRDMFCKKCNITYQKTNSNRCGICGKALIPVTDNIPKCPTCQSTNIKNISTARKALHGMAFGVLSKTAQSQFECCNCGYKW